MSTAGRYFAEIVRALCVLGLLLFIVTPGASPALAQDYSQIGASPAVATSIAAAKLSPLCGGGWGDDQSCHGPCHACRSGLPALPRAPTLAEPVFRSAAPVVYADVWALPVPSPLAWLPPSHGPPLA
ncbi:MAG TPA: hypothetical protein VL418_07960 [Devosiaceae bacterium]|nr:hypothetical protein [Devosiaceae bacterium]